MVTNMPYCGDKVYILTPDGEIKKGILATAFFGMEDSPNGGIKVGISYPHDDGTFDYEELDASIFAIRGFATLERAQEMQEMYLNDKETRESFQALEHITDFMSGIREATSKLSDVLKNINPDDLKDLFNSPNNELYNIDDDDAQEYFDYNGDEEEDE